MNLFPQPRSLKFQRGTFTLPTESAQLILGSARAPRAVFSALAEHNSRIRLIKIAPDKPSVTTRKDACASHLEYYALTISKSGIEISFYETGGFHAAMATLRQIVRECVRGTDLRSAKSQAGTPVPLSLRCLEIRDWPDFPRRGVMLDISRGRVPKLETLLDLVERLADFKINELQLYTEHTFAYRRYISVWKTWGALTGTEIRKLDKRCRELGIDLVPNQNSFGHLREWLVHPKLKKLGEVCQPYESDDGSFLRYPSTLAPNHPGTLPFLRGLYDELLPNFSSQLFNAGCDETWDLGRGQSKDLCARIGKGRVYLSFLKKIHHELSKRGKRMMFWGDIILKYPKLIPELAKTGRAGLPRGQADRQVSRTIIALNWGYEAIHPFEREARLFAKSRIPFYVCPGTSTWQTLVGRHDNAFGNLRAAATAGLKHGAIGYLVTDWGDGGHPQPLVVSWIPYLYGASVSWYAKSFDERILIPVLSRDVFRDPTQRMAKAAFALGLAHRKLKVRVANETPLGTAIAAPPPAQRELFCRNGLRHYARIAPKNIRAALKEVEKQRLLLNRARPETESARILQCELDLAARMAEESCRFMLWQQAAASRKYALARKMATDGVCRLRKLERAFRSYWPRRNKATAARSSTFLRWRMNDYRAGRIAFPADDPIG